MKNDSAFPCERIFSRGLIQFYSILTGIFLFCFSTKTFGTPTADFTASPQIACVGQNVTFTSTSTGTIISYSWNFGSGASPASASTAGPHLVSYSTTGTKTITLTVTAADGTNTTTKVDFVNVTSSAPTISTVFGSTNVCSNAGGISYSVTPSPLANSYLWTVPSGASIVSGQGSSSVNVNFGTAGGNVCVTASNGCGNSAQQCKAVQVGKDQIILMSYNLLNYPDQGNVLNDTTLRNPYLRTTLSSVSPDILVTQENTGANSVTGLLNYVLNPAIGGYAAATFINGFDSDNALFYKSSKFSFVSNTPIITDLRDINEFKLVHLLSGDTIRIFSVHLKASNTASDEAQRALEIDSLRKYTDALPAGTNFLICGDFNIYKSTESCYQKLLAVTPGADGQFYDAITMTGTWNTPTYAQYHTQSTRTRAFGGGATGGVDDRFDLILYSNAMMQTGGISYVPGSMYPLGNDGNHYGDSINSQPNTAVSVAVANALHYQSDHLPVIASIEFQNASCPNADLGAVALIDPVQPSCSTPAQNLQVQVKNYGSNQVNFAYNNLQVNLAVTLPNNSVQNFTSTLSSGVLSGGGLTTITFPLTLDMSSAGTYTFNASTVFSGDTIPSNNAMSPVSIDIYANTLSSITPGGATTFCSGGSVLLNATQSGNITYQWKLNGNDIQGAVTSAYTATATGNYSVQLQKTNQVTVNHPAATFSNSSAFSIPNNSCTGASSTITVSGYQGTVASSGISIKVNITHTAVGDLVLFLEAPNGNRLGLSNRTGNSSNTGDNFTNTIFSDAGATQIPTSGAPYTGTYKPWTTSFTSCVAGTITTFGAIGGGTINPNGNWKLLVYDRNSGNTGSIQNWQITFPSYSVSTSLVCDPVLSSPVQITVNPNPVISYQPTIPVICSNGGITITVLGASTYLWSPSSGLSSTTGSSVFANPPVATTYTVTGTDVNGCSASTSIPVTLHTPPVVTLGNYNTVCVNTSPFVLTGGSPSGGIYSGPGVSGGVFNPATAGAGTHTITYTYTDTNGCSAAASSAIIVNAIPPAAIFPSGSLSLCTGSTLTLAATSGYNYSWSTGATTSFIPVSSAGNYSVTVSDANGCSASSSPVNVTVNANQLIIPLFVESMGNPTGNTAINTWEANNGFDNISLSMSGSGEVRNTTVSTGYAGASGSGNVFLTNTAGRNFIISGINTNGLSNLQLQFGVFKSTTASNGSELQVLVSDNGGAYVQLPFTALPTGTGTTGWYLRAITSGIPASSNLSIQFLQTGTTPQFRIDDVMILYANPSPQISSSGSANICQGNSVTLTSAFASHYLWDTGDTTRSIIVNTSAPHQCVVTGYSGCVASTNSINVTSKPTLFSVTGGGTICKSSNGLAIGLSSSESGVSYQLKLNGVNSGLAVTGNGSAISFGLRNQAGTYTVFATETSSGCTATMNSSATIVVNPSPTNFSLIGGGNFCSGSSGVNIGLSGSETGIIYALQLNGVPTGNSPSGTGSALSFGNVNQSGTYTVFATNTSTTCAATLAGNIVVTQISSPQNFTVTGGGSYCPGQTGPSIGLSSSQNAVTYQLYNQNGIVGSGISGTGSSLSFGSQTGPATFYIIATASNGCSSQMSGTVSSTPLPEPSLFSVSGGGTFCPQDVAGTTVGLSHSESGVNYSLLLGGLPTGNTVSGDGILPVDFGLQSSPGIYTVIATKISDGCTLTMNGSATVAALPVLNWYADTDNDGYGYAASVVQSCSQPSGYISDASDCNDQNADINPGAVEICGNNIDDNCDGQTDEGCSTTLSLHLYLQGFYTGSGMMRAVAAPLSAPSVCDTITVELASATGFHQVVYSSTAVLNVNGNASVVFPPSVSGQSLYLVIRHRNSIRTWSATPVLFNAGVNQFDFATALSNAYGNNQFLETDGTISILTGDINQDGFATLADFTILENALTDFQNQYRPEDINGDGLVESEDYSLLENAIMNGHHEIHP